MNLSCINKSPYFAIPSSCTMLCPLSGQMKRAPYAVVGIFKVGL